MRGHAIFSLFGSSPFGPIQIHMKKVIECAHQLRPLFDAVYACDNNGLQQTTERINQLEHEADQLKNDLRNHLPKSLFLAVDRRDLLDLIHTQDSIADSTQEVAGMLTLKTLQLPEDFHLDVKHLLGEVLVTCDLAAAIASEMDELVEASFGGPEAERVLEMIKQLDDVETKSDVVGVHLARRLFTLEDQLSPVDLMLWYQIFYTVGQVANNAERMGNRLRLLIAHA